MALCQRMKERRLIQKQLTCTSPALHRNAARRRHVFRPLVPEGQEIVSVQPRGLDCERRGLTFDLTCTKHAEKSRSKNSNGRRCTHGWEVGR